MVTEKMIPTTTTTKEGIRRFGFDEKGKFTLLVMLVTLQ